jgi:DNA-binding NtrC family response regulator
LTEEDILRLNHFSHLYIQPTQKTQDEDISPQFVKLKFEYEKVNLKQIDKLYAIEILHKMNGNKSKTAKQLGISRPKLDILLKLRKN